MKKIIYIINLFCLTMLIYSCAEESIGQTPMDSVPPQNVTDVKVDNTPGGAILTYKLPNDEDLLCVKATYILNNGKVAEAKSSVYTDTLTLMGFGDTNERMVKITTIDRSANESEPIEVKIKPLEAPIFEINKTLAINAAFGGVNVTWENPTAANIVINIDMLNEKNEYVTLEKIYTKAKIGIAKIRGMKAEESQLKYNISDRWDNVTIQNDVKLTPMLEERVPNNTIEPMVSYSTKNAYGGDWALNKLFDDNTTWSGFHTIEDDYWPHYFTLKMMKGKVRLSRIRLFQREGYYYIHGNLKRFALYGRNSAPKSGDRIYSDDPDYANWIKIGEFESYKPSGLPMGQNNNEDIDYAQKGEDFDVEGQVEPYQYYRIESLASWGGSTFICFTELRMWGSADGFEFPKE